jgi:hypothetical protein
MQVRRHVKDREWDGTQLGAFIKLQIESSDKLTFLYIRNGERVSRLSCDLDFGEMIFPNRGSFDMNEPKMARIFADSVSDIISKAEFDAMVEKEKAARIKNDEWIKANPDKHPFLSPFRESGLGFSSSSWEPFDHSSVYFDDCMKEIEKKLKEYNRVATIIQGLFDRSDALHPHLPVQTWTGEGFRKAVHLVYDSENVLYDGLTPPDFEAYMNKCNRGLGRGSIVTGQYQYWLEKEAEKENARMARDWRIKNRFTLQVFKPYGNPGPARVAKIEKWSPKSRTAGFSWMRERQKDGGYYSGKRYGDPIRTTLSVPESRLFNISAYKRGDFKQFFRDPRTREQYFKWAPFLLTAEDFLAGKIACGTNDAKDI